MEDLTGKVFGYLKVISIAEDIDKGINSKWNAVCTKCGFNTKLTYAILKGLKKHNRSGCLLCPTPEESLVGQIFGTAKVVSINIEITKENFIKGKRPSQRYWNCVCTKCSNKLIRSYDSLWHAKKENSQTCNMCPPEDLTGMKFGRWTVLEYCGLNQYGANKWKCQCKCGNIKDITGTRLINGDAYSCGCYQKERVLEYCKKNAELYFNHRKENIYDLSREYGICYTEDK